MVLLDREQVGARIAMGSERSGRRDAAVTRDGSVVVTLGNGTLTARRTSDGEKIWSVPAGDVYAARVGARWVATLDRDRTRFYDPHDGTEIAPIERGLGTETGTIGGLGSALARAAWNASAPAATKDRWDWLIRLSEVQLREQVCDDAAPWLTGAQGVPGVAKAFSELLTTACGRAPSLWPATGQLVPEATGVTWVWKAPTGIREAFPVAGGVAVLTDDERLGVVSLDGQLRWSRALREGNLEDGGPDTLLLVGRDRVDAWDAQTGALRWSLPLRSGFVSAGGCAPAPTAATTRTPPGTLMLGIPPSWRPSAVAHLFRGWARTQTSEGWSLADRVTGVVAASGPGELVTSSAAGAPVRVVTAATGGWVVRDAAGAELVTTPDRPVEVAALADGGTVLASASQLQAWDGGALLWHRDLDRGVSDLGVLDHVIVVGLGGGLFVSLDDASGAVRQATIVDLR